MQTDEFHVHTASCMDDCFILERQIALAAQPPAPKQRRTLGWKRDTIAGASALAVALVFSAIAMHDGSSPSAKDKPSPVAAAPEDQGEVPVVAPTGPVDNSLTRAIDNLAASRAVPNVVGMNLGDALASLRAAGFYGHDIQEVGTSRLSYFPYTAWRVTSQPEAGKVIAPYKRIVLVVEKIKKG